MTQQSNGLPFPAAVEFAEQKYTNEFLEHVADFSFDEEDLSDYSRFYTKNPAAGYAFHRLKALFEKIDMFLGVKSPKAFESPWDYFSNVDSLATFNKKIIELTEKLQVSSEPLVVEKVRIADRGHVRKQMLKRLINLDPSERTFDSEILEHLKDRHRILNSFWKAVYTERDRKKQSKRSTEGNSEANKSLLITPVDSNQGCDKERSLPKQETILPTLVKKN
jgi:hypothetical protein